MSDTVDVIGYTITSGSNPRLKERAENAIVRGEMNTTDRAMVAIITASNLMKSRTVAFQRKMPNIEVPIPTVTPLMSAKVMTACRRRWKSLVFLV